MKTTTNHLKLFKQPVLLLLFTVFRFHTSSAQEPGAVPAPPPPPQEAPAPPPADWLPPGDPAAQQGDYYYLPDIETYYDMRNREFVYIEDGNWVFSPFLPPMYAAYDLRNAFAVMLDYRVHEPWMYHHMYVSHYPRYYYRSMYAGEARPVRGYNENVRTVFYGERAVAHPLVAHPTVGYRTTRPVEYRGGAVGHPVVVEKNMMKPGAPAGGNRAPVVNERRK